MSRRPQPQQLNLALTPLHTGAYFAAARLLARIMGAQAPDAAALIRAQLAGRDAIGVADDFLDSIGWPLKKGRAVSVRRRDRKRLPAARTSCRHRSLVSPRDPSRN